MSDALLEHWWSLSDACMSDAERDTLSDLSRAGLAFEAGYACVLYLLGPSAGGRFEHPSAAALREFKAARRDIAVEVAEKHLAAQLSNPAKGPRPAALMEWARGMRQMVRAEREAH